MADTLRHIKPWNERIGQKDGVPDGVIKFAMLEEIAELREAIASRPAEVDDWVSVDERLPEVGTLVIVYSPPTKNDWPDALRIDFDYLDPDADADAPRWFNHGENYEHFFCVAKPEGSIGPSEEASYTHWRPVPAAPSHTTNKEK